MNEDDYAANIESAFEQAFAEIEIVRRDMEQAERDGRELIKAVVTIDTQRGDIVTLYTGDELSEDDEEIDTTDESKGFKVRVLAVNPFSYIGEDGNVAHAREAVCVKLEEGDLTTTEEFAAMYGDGDTEPSEASTDTVAEVQQDPNVCSCGANRQMCARNQNVFGGHLNEE